VENSRSCKKDNMWSLVARNYKPTWQRIKGNKDDNKGEKRAINDDTVTQHTGTIHLTSTNTYLPKNVTGNSCA
jgi:hypothetical protein